MRKYLKKPEEIIKALKEGKEVKSDAGYRYKMIDGVICSLFDKGWVVGTDIDDDESPYIEEAEPLKFEVGKFYKNRKGEKLLCVFIGNETLTYPVKLISPISGEDMFYTIEGRYTNSAIGDPNDIIGEWEE